MAACLTCSHELGSGARFCPRCGAPAGSSSAPGFDLETVAPVMGTRSASHGSGSRPSWLSSSGSLDDSRFVPGAIVQERYRIFGRLGKGGMGEVYRADDLRLGQPVALKFLPPALEHDPVKLAQFHAEVRLARRVSHPNVCRVYDIGEADGVPFLSMELVDGEDLASLLRRIGRLPQDKAVDIARQLCGGLSAAHQQGVLHRDLKPANVMLDGEGRVRLTDFGLAAAAGARDESRAGTPAYMSPEQLGGREVTARSDIFALGLVLYEIFTGRRVFEVTSLADLVRRHENLVVEPPTRLVPDLDPAVERVILRCLEYQPERRPASALLVAAALPGGDPLAAALAAGETPSPEVVAAAGEAGGLSTARTALLVLALLALLAATVAWSAVRQVTTLTTMDRPPAVLADRAQQALTTLGYEGRPADTWWAVGADGGYIRYVETNVEYATRQDPYGGRPGALRFYYRTSPRALVPRSPVHTVALDDPPLQISGMATVTLDMEGRLVSLTAVPPQREAARDDAPAPEWSTLFTLAGLDIARFTPVAPEWLPRTYADARAAWNGVLPDRPDVPIRVEAAAWQGRPVQFDIIGPWTRPTRMEEEPSGWGTRVLRAIWVLATVALLAAALVVARWNVRAGRGDRRGAVRIAIVAVVGSLIPWLFNDPHFADPQVQLMRFFLALGEALFAGAAISVLYLALEPAMRRYWPDSLLGWSRLMQGRIVDARVGRDVLVGLAAGAVMALLGTARGPIQGLAGHPDLTANVANLRYLEGPTYVLGLFASLLSFQAMFNAMWCVIAIVGLKRLLDRMWLVAIAAVAFLTLVAAGGLYVNVPGLPIINVAVAVAVVSVLVGVVIRFGLLATVVMFLGLYVLTSAPWSLQPGRWDFSSSAIAFALLVGLACLAGWAMVERQRTTPSPVRTSAHPSAPGRT